MILQSGHMPSVLQQLCRLPFQYFSEKKLQAVLFPTLLACCHDNQSNRIILEKEMSYQVTTRTRQLFQKSRLTCLVPVDAGRFRQL